VYRLYWSDVRVFNSFASSKLRDHNYDSLNLDFEAMTSFIQRPGWDKVKDFFPQNNNTKLKAQTS